MFKNTIFKSILWPKYAITIISYLIQKNLEKGCIFFLPQGYSNTTASLSQDLKVDQDLLSVVVILTI